jgi:hypothetical protein
VRREAATNAKALAADAAERAAEQAKGVAIAEKNVELERERLIRVQLQVATKQHRASAADAERRADAIAADAERRISETRERLRGAEAMLGDAENASRKSALEADAAATARREADARLAAITWVEYRSPDGHSTYCNTLTKERTKEQPREHRQPTAEELHQHELSARLAAEEGHRQR